ncbi:galactokinase [Streptomyces sp. NRRL F-4489]|uniref:mevalonate kinase family protein n=1 Tax=Streptomyces sp. NRRL F-4489 TaxID=1609095 RepID=UPI000747B785|nr:galactokinase [Streptomyces sp. NRRL F-4489]KUL46134.1 galactokinase [Streptomyces sp. NRRL F-4489]
MSGSSTVSETADGAAARPRGQVAVPCRACLSGEDLDWLGGRSVSLALDLMTTVAVRPPGARPAAPEGGGWADEVWAFLRSRLPGLGDRPPAVTVRSDAPAASGLSSSTALIVALFRAFTDAAAPPGSPPVPAATLARWAYEFEFAVFNGGGMDHLAVIAGGLLLLDGRTTGLPEIRERADFPGEWAVVVLDSGTRKDTSDHIRTVRGQLATGDARLAAYRERTDAASAAVWDAVHRRDLAALGTAMTAAHTAMRDLQGMSTPLLEDLRTLARRAAGLPLKLSGAGGGGALVGVCPAADRAEVVARLRRALAPAHPRARVIPARAAAGLAPDLAAAPAGQTTGRPGA